MHELLELLTERLFVPTWRAKKKTQKAAVAADKEWMAAKAVTDRVREATAAAKKLNSNSKDI